MPKTPKKRKRVTDKDRLNWLQENEVEIVSTSRWIFRQVYGDSIRKCIDLEIQRTL